LVLSAALLSAAQTFPAAPSPSSPSALRAESVTSSDPVSRLQHRLDENQARLEYEPSLGYLRSLLQALRIPPASQLLVFSKTSCQRERISPQTPRAIFFNDEAYVAFIPGSPFIEVSAVDPQAGATFYTLEQKDTPGARLIRRDQCLECHTSSQTLNVPGYLVRSYATDGQGVIDITVGCSMVDHRTPLAERWGGWYICGTGAPFAHRGNLLGSSTAEKEQPDAPVLGNAALKLLAEPSKYPEPTSDIAAVLVLEHQAQMQNLITRLRVVSKQSPGESLQTPELKAAVNDLVQYLLFADEAELETPIASGLPFAAHFEARGPFDRHGRCLRQFDLKTRLFKYPCSYMIYSEAFDALPRQAKLLVYRRLWKILTLQDTDAAFARTPAETKRAILEILLETKTDLPIDWTLSSATP
jgi:hypothetical protein